MSHISNRIFLDFSSLRFAGTLIDYDGAGRLFRPGRRTGRRPITTQTDPDKSHSSPIFSLLKLSINRPLSPWTETKEPPPPHRKRKKGEHDSSALLDFYTITRHAGESSSMKSEAVQSETGLRFNVVKGPNSLSGFPSVCIHFSADYCKKWCSLMKCRRRNWSKKYRGYAFARYKKCGGEARKSRQSPAATARSSAFHFTSFPSSSSHHSIWTKWPNQVTPMDSHSALDYPVFIRMVDDQGWRTKTGGGGRESFGLWEN